MKAKKQKQLSPSQNIDWNVPDWRKEDAYPRAPQTGLAKWKWEFLRRRPDYRQDWLTYAPQAYEQARKTYEEKPFHENKAGNRILRWKKEEPLPPDHLDWTADMPGCSEKYGIPWLMNPKNPEPEELYVFVYAYSPIVEYTAPGEGFNMNVFGVDLVLSKSEVGILFNLDNIPIEKKMADIARRFPRKMSISDTPGDIEIYQNLLEMFLANANLKRNDVKVSRKPHQPRIIDHPEKKDHIIVIFNFAYAYSYQWKYVKAELKSRQKAYPISKRRKRPQAWTNLLRVLDAHELDVPFREIGKVVYGCDDKFIANPQAREAYEDALRIMYHFPD